MNFLDLTLLPTQKNFRPRKFYLPGNKYGYDSFMSSSISHVASCVKGQVGGSIPTGNNPPSMNGRRRVMGWGVLGCRPNTTGLRVAGGMPGKPKRIRGCYNILCIMYNNKKTYINNNVL